MAENYIPFIAIVLMVVFPPSVYFLGVAESDASDPLVVGIAVTTFIVFGLGMCFGMAIMLMLSPGTMPVAFAYPFAIGLALASFFMAVYAVRGSIRDAKRLVAVPTALSPAEKA